MTAAELPPALRPWAESLGFLTVEAALHLGPLVRRLDALVRRHDAADARTGEPDGYGGLSTRGHPERLLLSEWLLAEELPLEFMRRAAERELLHVAPSFRAAQPHGNVAVFCDVGPDQLGASRLVQLAALIVLHRRARDRGAALVVGVSGEDGWHEGELPLLYQAWRTAQRPTTPDRDELDARRGALDAGDELWVLAGDTLAAAAHDVPLLLHTREAAWDEHGVTGVELRFEGRTTVLPVPPGPVSVQALRGTALRRAPGTPPHAAVGAVSCPAFSSTDRRLLLRGATPGQIVVTPIPTKASDGAARPRLHRFSGPVLAATTFNKRLVALVVHDDHVSGTVIGRDLGRLEQVHVPLDTLGLDPERLPLDTLPPLYFDNGRLLLKLARTWWRLGYSRASEEHDILAIGPGERPDQPAIMHGVPDHDLRSMRGPWLAGQHWTATSLGGEWRMRGPGSIDVRIPVPDDHTVLGAITRPDRHGLVAVDADEQVWRHAPAGAERLPACSGAALGRALHQRFPLLAVQRDHESVEVHDLTSDERPIEVRFG